jgi:hypothetical protein
VTREDVESYLLKVGKSKQSINAYLGPKDKPAEAKKEVKNVLSSFQEPVAGGDAATKLPLKVTLANGK